MKKTAIILFLLASLPCLAQTDNTFYVKQFQGTTIGAKLANAQSACSSNAAIKCIIVIDPSLAVWPAGTMPVQCANCIWFDYRTSNPTSPNSQLNLGATQIGSGSSGTASFPGAIAASIVTPIPMNISLVFAGDSRCIQDTNNQTWTYILRSMSQFNGHISAWHNTCIAGRKIEDVASAYVAEVQPYKPATTYLNPTYLFVYVGVNNMSDAGSDTPAQAYAALAAYWARAVSDGFTVIAMTEPMAGTTSNGSYTSNRIEQLNDLIRTAPSGSYSKLIDMATALPNPYNRAFFQSDFVHPTYPAGNYFEAQFVNWAFGGPYPGSVQSQFDGRQPGSWNYSCDITGLGLTTFAGAGDTVCGILAGQNITTGQGVSGFGSYSANGDTTGNYNTGGGYFSLWKVTDGNDNTGDGANSLNANVHGNDNYGGGSSALFYNTASQNTATGSHSGYSNTIGTFLDFNGFYSGYSNLDGNENTCGGFECQELNVHGSDLTSQGFESLLRTTAGPNDAFGSKSLSANTTGAENAGFAHLSLGSNVNGNNNTCAGNACLFGNISGSDLTALGLDAGAFIANGSTPNQTSNHSVYLGELTKAHADGDVNEIVIGDGATGAGSNTAQIGNPSVTVGYIGPNQVCLANGAGCPYASTGLTDMTAALVSSDVTMTTAGTYYDGPTTGSQVAGTWLLSSVVSLQTTSTASAVNFTCKLWDGTTVFASTQKTSGAVAVAAARNVSISLTGIAVQSGSSTMKISCTADTASQRLLYQTTYSTTAGASTITAVRIK